MSTAQFIIATVILSIEIIILAAISIRVTIYSKRLDIQTKYLDIVNTHSIHKHSPITINDVKYREAIQLLKTNLSHNSTFDLALVPENETICKLVLTPKDPS